MSYCVRFFYGRKLQHFRTQFAVGQGGFHAGWIFVNGAKPFTYVYDCGGTKKDIDREVDFYKKKFSGKKIDVVFLSHFHVDHVNGLERLLPKTGNLKANLIVMPFLEAVDRLINFATYSDLKSAPTVFEIGYVANGISYLKENLNVERVIQVTAKESDQNMDVVGWNYFNDKYDLFSTKLARVMTDLYHTANHLHCAGMKYFGNFVCSVKTI